MYRGRIGRIEGASRAPARYDELTEHATGAAMCPFYHRPILLCIIHTWAQRSGYLMVLIITDGRTAYPERARLAVYEMHSGPMAPHTENVADRVGGWLAPAASRQRTWHSRQHRCPPTGSKVTRKFTSGAVRRSRDRSRYVPMAPKKRWHDSSRGSQCCGVTLLHVVWCCEDTKKANKIL